MDRVDVSWLRFADGVCTSRDFAAATAVAPTPTFPDSVCVYHRWILDRPERLADELNNGRALRLRHLSGRALRAMRQANRDSWKRLMS